MKMFSRDQQTDRRSELAAESLEVMLDFKENNSRIYKNESLTPKRAQNKH